MQYSLGLVLVYLALASAAPENKGQTKFFKRQPSIIHIIADGFGPASETFARSAYQQQKGLPWTTQLTIDKYLVGTLRTRSTDSLVTDSAASATAYSSGVKSVNAYIGVDIDKLPVATVLEGAKAKGYNTGLVATSRITHATPASYAAHIDDRDLENEIAAQMIGNNALGRSVDLMFGGGARHFWPNTTKGSSRKDSRDLVAEAASKFNFSTVQNRTQFDALKNGTNVKFPVLGLFARSHMAYEIDRNSTVEPSLTEMAITALNALKKAGKPFFIMLEASRVDHAAHNNDPIGHYYDILEYNRMFAAVAKWVEKNNQEWDENPEVIMVATADHECGGLTLALQRPEDSSAAYLWYPEVLFNATHSTEYLAGQFLTYYLGNRTESDNLAYLKNQVTSSLGIKDVQDDEISHAYALAKADSTGVALAVWLSSIVNWRAHLGWSTTGHSGVDVNVYTYAGKNKKANQWLQSEFQGNHENVYLGQWTTKYLDLKLQPLTRKLNNGTNHIPGSGSANYSTPIERYHGGVKRVIPALPQTTPASKKRSNVEIGWSHAANDMLYGRGLGHHQVRRYVDASLFEGHTHFDMDF